MAKHLNNKHLIIAVLAAFALYFCALILAPQPIDWRLSFSKKDKIPFGNSILFDELKQLVSQDSISTMHSPIYSFLQQNDLQNSGWIFINDFFYPDELDTDKMLGAVEQGSHVFLAATSFSEDLYKTLRFKLNEDFTLTSAQNDSTILNLSNPLLRSNRGYIYKRAFNKVYFQSFDTLNTTVLGIGDKGVANFIKIKYGTGSFFINLNPLAFTNYNLLIGQNYEYAFKCLSYLPNTSVIWDEHYKQQSPVSGSAFRYILSQKALRNAWYMLLLGIIIYMVFAAKRRQRAIPIVQAPQNTSLSFVETIGRLYFSRKNHLDIALKRYTYFLAFLRRKYYIDTDNLHADSYKEISEKLNVPGYMVKQLFNMAQRFKKVKSITQEELEQFSKKIDFFYELK
ncbi:hypothetical protein SAMN06265379_11086 [Saccharicrinis carchari]|uniref:DUF4350 domain-containing protein n=1 Tax=Saccharicrinis carchari TaxID=1168039 RepID=A0A521EPZ1_SACCC|nr:DUF4350 domain-containing protein [Saccharicrinis carchari]SMO86009.1 hypothetical protein SAMN06265379_11086 [Saccharicrinis carchari]